MTNDNRGRRSGRDEGRPSLSRGERRASEDHTRQPNRGKAVPHAAPRRDQSIALPEYLVLALEKVLRSHNEVMRKIAREPGLAQVRHDAGREALGFRPASLVAIDREIRRLKAELESDRLQTGPGSAWQKTRDDLSAELRRCEAALESAQRALDSKTVEIKGRPYPADGHIEAMKASEKRLYKKIVARHPYHQFFLDWTIGDRDEADRKQLETEIAAVESEYAQQTSAKSSRVSSLTTQRRDLLQQLADHEASVLVIGREKERLQELLATRETELNDAEKSHRALVATKLEELDDRQKAVVAKTNLRLEAQQHDFNKNRSAAVSAIDKAVASLLRNQPPLVRLRPNALVLADAHPAEICLGWFLARGEPNWECLFPSTVPFPIPQAIRLSADDDCSRSLAQTLLLRLLTALPPNGLTVRIIDPLQLGASLGPLRRLLDRPGPLLGREVCTLADEIEEALREENDRLEELVQITLRDGSDTWRGYNTRYPRTPLQYRVVVYYDAPEQLTDKSLVFLQRLVQLGPQRGILPIVVTSDRAADDRRSAPLRKTLAENADDLGALFREDAGDVRELFAGVAHSEALPDEMPPPNACDQVLDEVSVAYGAAMNKAPRIEELWGDSDLWRHSATDGLIIPIGWSRDGAPVNLELGRPGGTGIHTLVAGRPGSGKSSLLHVLLHSLCHRYSPAEVRVMLLDYKQGVEMAMYASPVLPHADLVAMDSDVSYGVTVLEHLKQEIERRAKLFQEARKTSLDQYNRSCEATKRLPRILLLIDEFQVLFAEDRATTTDVESLLIALLRQGRAYGVHVLLCTQTLSGLTNISLTQLTALIAERICLACDAQDSAKTLASGNEAGTRLAGPPEAILNSANGSAEANRLFIFPEPRAKACQKHLSELAQKAPKTDYQSSAQLFRGDEAIALPDPGFFAATIGSKGKLVGVIGQALSFRAGPLIVELPTRLGGHVLLTGPSSGVREGILMALLQSLACQQHPLQVLVYNVRDDCRWQKIADSLFPGTTVSTVPADWTGDFTTLPELLTGRHGVFVIDGLDQDRLLKTGASRPRIGSPSPTPGATATEFLETAHKKGWRVIATADNWRRLDTPERRDLLNEFQIRIGSQMPDDDASRMTFNAARAFGIGGNLKRAIFFDQYTNRLERFRPFVLKD
jgi:S-DNA-T family DNA segregation ATPase FtsK/SpoIIIE